MGIIRPQVVKVNWAKCNHFWYRQRGYDQPAIGNILLVDVDDLPPGSGRRVDVECDYCGKRYKKVYQTICYGKHDGAETNEKIACSQCRKYKVRELMIEVHGVEAPMQIPAVRAKSVITCRKRYGVDHPMKVPKIVNSLVKKLRNKTPEQKQATIDKRENTNMKKYGTTYAMLLPKNRKRMHIALYKQGKAPSSAQQRALCSLLNGKLNYPVSNLFLDIAWPEHMVYMEYDGSGHEYRVTRGECTHEQFVLRELKRDKFLTKRGWRRIRVVSAADLLPDVNWLAKVVDQFVANANVTWLSLTIHDNMVVADSNLSSFKWSALVQTTTIKQMKKQEAANG